MNEQNEGRSFGWTFLRLRSDYQRLVTHVYTPHETGELQKIKKIWNKKWMTVERATVIRLLRGVNRTSGMDLECFSGPVGERTAIC